MNQHTRFNLPLCLKVEEDAFSHAEEIVTEYLPGIKGQKSLVISEQFLIDLYSEKIRDIQRDFYDAELYTMGNAEYDEAVVIAKRICMEDIKIVIGIGGGRVLDTAKYAAFISKAVFICLPTTLSNDSLASPFAVLGTVNQNRKTLPCKIPTAIIVDTDLILNAPIAQTLSGIGDTLAKYTALYDWRLSAAAAGTPIDDFADGIASLSFDSVFHCDEKNLKSKSFIRILSRALVMGGLAMEIADSTRPCSGSEHLFCHAIEEYYPQLKISHGVGVALGSIGACVFQGRDESRLMEVMLEYGIDMNPMSYGITKDIFFDLWTKAPETRPNRVTILNSTKPDRAWLDEIYDRMCETAHEKKSVKR